MAGTLNPLSVGLDNTFSLKAPGYVDQFVLSTAVQSYPIPAGASHVLMSASGNFAASYTTSSASVAMPTTTPTTDGSGAELNPSMRQISGKTNINLVAASSCYFTISSFKP